LESLDIRGDSWQRNTKTLDIRLQSRGGSLEKLATLRKLRNFEHPFLQGHMVKELEWMKLNWSLGFSKRGFGRVINTR
jgi:hypothetical protein